MKRQRADGVPKLRGPWRSQPESRWAGVKMPRRRLLLPPQLGACSSVQRHPPALSVPWPDCRVRLVPRAPEPRLLSWLHSTGRRSAAGCSVDAAAPGAAPGGCWEGGAAHPGGCPLLPVRALLWGSAGLPGTGGDARSG